MAKQEEIREGIRELLTFIYGEQQGARVRNADVTVLFSYLHSQGVVIKVERELPENEYIYPEDSASHTTYKMEEAYNHAQCNMLKAGYVAVEPLIIKEEQVNGQRL